MSVPPGAPAPTAPQASNNNPPASPAPAVQPNAAPSNAQQPSVPQQGIVGLDMMVKPGQQQLSDAQKERYTNGYKLINDSGAEARLAREDLQTLHQIQQRLKESSGSKPGQLVRSAGKWLQGNEDLEVLNKSIADHQARQGMLMGASTDSARSNLAVANGSSDLTVGGLKEIVDRAIAQDLAFEKFNSGLQNFSKKFGNTPEAPYNAAIHAQNFQQAWNQNYDPKLFWTQAINSSGLSQAQKELEIQRLHKGMSADELNNLQEKMIRIKRLQNGDR
jgi:hypothetical protein